MNDATGGWCPATILDFSFSIFESGRTVTVCYKNRRVEVIPLATWGKIRKSTM